MGHRKIGRGKKYFSKMNVIEMVKIKDTFLFLFLIFLLLFNYFFIEQKHLLLNLFLIIFISFSFLSLTISSTYGANILGWGAIFRYKDYTSIFIYLTEMGLMFNVLLAFYYENYLLILVMAGFIIMLIGMVFNLLVRKELGKNWVPLAKSTEDQELVTSGIYSRIRHPFYTSILILFLGVALMALNILGTVFYFLFIISIHVRIKKEENELIHKFGSEYIKYKDNVPKLIPKLISI